jgi:hypothetical protein
MSGAKTSEGPQTVEYGTLPVGAFWAFSSGQYSVEWIVGDTTDDAGDAWSTRIMDGGMVAFPDDTRVFRILATVVRTADVPQ